MSKKEQCSASERTFETVHEFCKAWGISDAAIEDWIRITNDSWIEAGNLSREGFSDYLDDLWRKRHLAVRGLCPWLIDLVELGARIKPPLIYDDGTVFAHRSRERRTLLKELQRAYDETKCFTFSTTTGAAIERARDLRVVLILRLLGCAMSICDLKKFSEAKGFDWSLLSLLKANATIKKKTVPTRIFKLAQNPEMLLLGAYKEGD